VLPWVYCERHYAILLLLWKLVPWWLLPDDVVVMQQQRERVLEWMMTLAVVGQWLLLFVWDLIGHS